MRIYSYFIPGIPVTKKNSQQMAFNPKTKRWFPVPSKAYKRFEKNAEEAFAKRDVPTSPIDCPVIVVCTYIFPKNKDGTIPKKRPDLSNLLEATDDILVKYKILEDDNVSIVVSHDGSRACYTDSFDPGTHIFIVSYNKRRSAK